MRPARLSAAGLALLACAIFAARAAFSRPQDAADPVLEAEFVLTDQGHYSQGAAEVRVRGDGSVTVSVDTIGPEPRPPAHVEQYRLSAEERRTLAALVRQVDFFAKSDPEPGPRERWLEGPTLRITLDGQSHAREKLDSRALEPLANWFHRFVAQTRLLRDLRKGQGVRMVAQALGHDSHQVARRSDFRAPLREFAERCVDPKELLVALGALAPLEEPGPWGEFVVRRVSALGADAELTLVDRMLRGCWETEGRVTEAHRATLFAHALSIVRTCTRQWADLERETKHVANYIVNVLARNRYGPLLAALPEIARECSGQDPGVALPLHYWGERGFEVTMKLLSAPEEGVRRSALLWMGGFRYEPRGRHEAEHPVPAEERARVRARLLSEGVARLDAMGEDAAESREMRRLARSQAGGLRPRSAPKPPEPPPPGVSIEVIGEDDWPVPGVRVRGVNTTADRRPASDEPPPTATAVSDASGVALFKGLTGRDWEFDADDPRFASRAATRLTWQEGMRVRLRLLVRARSVLSGRLVGNSGRPLVGVAVQRLREDGTPLEEDRQVVTDDAGRVTFAEVPSRRPGRILIRLAGGRTLTLEERYLVSGKDWGVDFGPEGDGVDEPSIRGRVVGADGEGLSAAVVAVTDNPPPGSTSSPSWTRPDGTFEIYGLAPGDYRLWATPQGSGRAARGTAGFADVAEVPARGVTITILFGKRITGRVDDPSGKPVVGLAVIARRREPPAASAPVEHSVSAMPPPGFREVVAFTDHDGRFLLENLQDGEYEFTAGPGASWWFDRGVVVKAGGDPVTLRALVCDPLVGTAVTGDGVGLRGVEVIATRLPGRDHQCRAKTDEAGAFSVVGVDPESTYELNVNFNDGAPSEPTAKSAPGARTVTLVADAGALGSVVVKDRFGDRVPRMKVLLRHAESGRVFVRECDASGEFHLPYRMTGRWTVERNEPKPGRETVLGTVESGVAGQPIALPEEWE